MNLYFCYELGTRGWSPVVFHGEKPAKKKYDVERSTLHDVPPDCLDMSGTPMFGKLKATFPAP